MKRKALRVLALACVFTLFCASCLASAPRVNEALKAIEAINSKDLIKAKYLYVSPSAVTLRLGGDLSGESFALKAKAKPLAASQSFTWWSTNESIATVDEAGNVTPTGLGRAYVRCTTIDGSYLKKRVAVTVKPLKVSSITLSASSLSLSPNESYKLECIVSPENAYDNSVVWKSSNANVASVDKSGVVTAKKLGSCTITCTSVSSGVSAKASVKVNFSDTDVYYMCIGQEKYISASTLQGCKMDADRFVASITSSQFGNSSPATGKTLYDLTGAGLKSAFNDIASWGMDENDVTYIYYSGHGSGYSSFIGALIGIDYVNKASYTSTCITVDEIRNCLDRVPGTVIIAVDACYSGNFISDVKALGDHEFTSSFIRGFIAGGSKSIIDDNELAGKYKLIVACQPDEMSYLAGNNYGSVFTRFVTQAAGIFGMNVGQITINKKMAGDSNNDGCLSLKEIFNYAYPKINKYIKERYDGFRTQRMMVWPTADPYPVFARLK